MVARRHLRYLPVNALFDDKQYLCERYASCVFTPARRDVLGRAPSANWRVAAFGVATPVPGTSFAPLKFVPSELSAVADRESDNTGAGALPGTRRLDGEFTRGPLTLALARNTPVLHIATQFSFNPGDYSKSFLLLGDGPLTIAEIRQRKF